MHTEPKLSVTYQTCWTALGQSTSRADEKTSTNGTANGNHLHVSAMKAALQLICLDCYDWLVRRTDLGAMRVLLDVGMRRGSHGWICLVKSPIEDTLLAERQKEGDETDKRENVESARYIAVLQVDQDLNNGPLPLSRKVDDA